MVTRHETSLSVGHRRELGVVIAVLGLERNHMGKRLHSYCIYTTVSPEKLKAVEGEITDPSLPFPANARQ
jgi:hypothetical protein